MSAPNGFSAPLHSSLKSAISLTLPARTGRTLETENSRSRAHRLSGASIGSLARCAYAKRPPVTMEGLASPT
jgi:hypothetical protein